MTTYKIIAAAREAEAYATSQTNDIVDWKAIAQERFYALAYRAGMERAAEICEEEALRFEPSRDFSLCIAAILAHAKTQPESTHDTGNV